MDLLNSQIQHQLNSALTQNQMGGLESQMSGLSEDAGHVLNAGGKLSKAQRLEKLEETSKEFEAIFFQQMLEAMDKTIDREDSMFYGGHAEKTFRGMFNQEVSKSFTERPGGSGLGLADTIYRQVSRLMEAQEAAEAAKVNNNTIEVSG